MRSFYWIYVKDELKLKTHKWKKNPKCNIPKGDNTTREDFVVNYTKHALYRKAFFRIEASKTFLFEVIRMGKIW